MNESSSDRPDIDISGSVTGSGPVNIGEAPRFRIYDPSGQLVEKRANPHGQEDHDAHTGPKKMVDLLPECGVFIARAMGSGQKVLHARYGVQPFFTTETTVQAALSACLGQLS